MTNTEFIRKYRDSNILELALKSHPEEVDVPYCLQQIEGWQHARKKLPSWTGKEGILYPARISMEQCSSQSTAEYKQKIVKILLPDNRNKMYDLTGGLGVDFSFIAPLFKEAIYMEQQEALCEVARHNFPLLGLNNSKVVCSNCENHLLEIENCDFIFLDPARRDFVGRKVFMLEDCTPNVCELINELINRAQWVMIKLSPMLDIKQALLKLPMTNEIHVVSVDGECKELLLLLSKKANPLTYHCINISKKVDSFSTESNACPAPISQEILPYLYEPNASILKAGVQDALCLKYDIEKLHPFSHLFCSQEIIYDFPGRKFKVINYCDFSKHELKGMLKKIKKANLAIRNFPSSVADLRKRLNLKEGGNTYLFATTLGNEKHVLIQCEKIQER